MPLPSHAQQSAVCEELQAHYLAAMRQRFKAEVNRMTSGAMQRLLGNHPQAERLSFPLSYVYAFHWLTRKVHPEYRPAVLAEVDPSVKTAPHQEQDIKILLLKIQITRRG